ncbi:O-acetylhomoserine aminocarboxypropyltransferase/cysteine synthase family protein [Bacillota bacterium LX-D]|nr:O-acetylhomoserine aminocarboxypropyltransferase/cysteine synthase family protein [Bacillota bacterium LX-D]
MRFNTALLHGNFAADEKTGATTTPIYQSSSFEHQSAEELENIFKGSEPGFVYTRINNPTIEAFERRIAHLEGGIGAVACASGMAAVTLALMNILKSGDEVVSGSGIFGGTFSLFACLEEFGVKTQYAKDNSIASFRECINEKTRLIFLETIGNPKLDVPDIRQIAELAHQEGIPLIVDNTSTTPYLVKPFTLGADIVVHSTSKYINGSGNSIGGIIVDSGKFKWNYDKFTSLKAYKRFGPFVYLAKLRKGLFKDFGACMAPFNAYLTSIGLETLGLRMDRLCDNAQKLAVSLKENSKVVKVNYPGLEENADHLLAKEQFNNKFGGILTIRVGTKEKAFKVINSLKYASNLVNIGDTRTLTIHPASTIYATNSSEEKEKMGVYEDLIRISVGLEDIEDIIEDFQQALEKVV